MTWFVATQAYPGIAIFWRWESASGSGQAQGFNLAPSPPPTGGGVIGILGNFIT